MGCGGSVPACVSGPIVHVKPGGRFTWRASEEYATKMGGRLLTLSEARAHLAGRALCPGEDQWCAVADRDWVQVGDRHHHPGKSHKAECGGYPPWGDDANNQTYGNPSWNYVVLYTTPVDDERTGNAPATCGGASMHNASALASELAEAAWNGDTMRVRSLLDRGAPANTEAHGGYSNGHHSALNGAARNGHAEIVSLLLTRGKPDIESRCQEPWSVTPLQQAGFWGRTECAKILLEHGASTSSRSGPGGGHRTAKEIAQEGRRNQWAELVHIIEQFEQPQPMAVTGNLIGGASAAAPSAPQDGDAPPPLIEIVDLLKRELGLRGTIEQVISASCEQLGVKTKGKSLIEQAKECWILVGHHV